MGRKVLNLFIPHPLPLSVTDALISCASAGAMPMPPEKIIMFSLPESGSDLSLSPDLSPNQEELPSKQNSSPADENPNPCTNQNEEAVEESLRDPATCSENQSHGAEKGVSFAHVVEGGAQKSTGETGAAASRKLPAWGSNQSAEDEEGRRGKSNVNASTEKNLQQVIEAFSVDFNEKKYADVDILEVAEMKGIVFQNPSWWPPEGFLDTL